MPKISIITPTYKWAWYITQTIESVRSQSFVDYEYIIINDNSPDDVEDIIKTYQKKDPRIIYIKNNKNLWIAWSRNKWVEIAQGKYICFLDHDDVFLDRDKLQKQYDFLEQHSDYHIVSSLIITIDRDWNILYNNHARETDEDIRNHLLQSNQFLPCAMMILKNAITNAWWFDSTYDKSDDYDLWMKIWRRGKMHCIQEYMTGYRVHDNNTSWSLKSLYHMRILARRIFRKNSNHYPNFRKAFFMRIFEFVTPPFIVKKIIYFIKKPL